MRGWDVLGLVNFVLMIVVLCRLSSSRARNVEYFSLLDDDKKPKSMVIADHTGNLSHMPIGKIETAFKAVKTDIEGLQTSIRRIQRDVDGKQPKGNYISHRDKIALAALGAHGNPTCQGGCRAVIDFWNKAESGQPSGWQTPELRYGHARQSNIEIQKIG